MVRHFLVMRATGAGAFLAGLFLLVGCRGFVVEIRVGRPPGPLPALGGISNDDHTGTWPYRRRDRRVAPVSSRPPLGCRTVLSPERGPARRGGVERSQHARVAGPAPGRLDPAEPAHATGADAEQLIDQDYPGLTVKTHVEQGLAGRCPIDTAQARHASLAVVGARGHGEVTGLLIGSVSEYVATHAKCPVVIVRGEAGDRRGLARRTALPSPAISLRNAAASPTTVPCRIGVGTAASASIERSSVPGS